MSVPIAGLLKGIGSGILNSGILGGAINFMSNSGSGGNGGNSANSAGDYANLIRENQQQQNQMMIFQMISQMVMQEFSTKSTLSKNGHEGAMTIIRNLKVA